MPLNMTLLVADVVWPALFLADRLVALEVIVIGLVIETVLLRVALHVKWRRAMTAACLMNLSSAIIGMCLLPVWGWYWEMSVTRRNKAHDWGTFNPMTWPETCCMAWLLTTLVEIAPLRLIVGRRKHLIWILLLANALSVGVAYASLHFLPARHNLWSVFDNYYASTSLITCPWTSVSRRSMPL